MTVVKELGELGVSIKSPVRARREIALAIANTNRDGREKALSRVLYRASRVGVSRRSVAQRGDAHVQAIRK